VIKVNHNKGTFFLAKQIYFFTVSDYKFIYGTHSVPLTLDPASNEMEMFYPREFWGFPMATKYAGMPALKDSYFQVHGWVM